MFLGSVRMCVCVRSSEVKSGKERKKDWRRERGTIEAIWARRQKCGIN